MLAYLWATDVLNKICLNAGLTIFDFLELAFHEVLLMENFTLPVVIVFIKVFDIVLSHDHVEVLKLFSLIKMGKSFKNQSE